MMILADMLKGVFAVDPAAPALEFEMRWLSWGDLAERAGALDAALDEAGLGEGVRVGMLLRNRPEFVPALVSVLSTRRCIASLNAIAPDDKLAADIRAVDVPVLLATAADWTRDEVRAAAREAGCLGLSLDVASDPFVTPVPGLPGDPARVGNREAHGIAIEMLSSGTTGTPKRIPLPLRNLEKALLSAAAFEKGRDPDAPPRLRSGVQIVTAPLAHIAGVTGVMNNLLAGRKICLIEKFTVEAFRDALVRHRPKVANAPPAALKMLLDADLPKEDFASLVALRSGTAPLPPETADAFLDRYGLPVLQNYGATEFAGGVAGWTLDDFKAHWREKRGSVGRLNRGAEARIVSPDTGAALPPGETGLLELRAPNIGDGTRWVRTTDLAALDADRFLWIRGRHDGAIIRGGFKILPPDVVKAMEAHPAVREAVVIGLDDTRLGQVPVAAWIAKANAAIPDDEELRAFLRERLMPYQLPARILRLDEFPRTPSMKVSEPSLRALFES